MKLNFIFFVILSSLIACGNFEGTRRFNGFDYYRVKPIVGIDSSLKVDVTYHAGNIAKIDFKQHSTCILSDTVIYNNGGIFLFQSRSESCQLFNDTMLAVTAKISDTVRS